jgi:hypothetical protein
MYQPCKTGMSVSEAFLAADGMKGTSIRGRLYLLFRKEVELNEGIDAHARLVDAAGIRRYVASGTSEEGTRFAIGDTSGITDHSDIGTGPRAVSEISPTIAGARIAWFVTAHPQL